MQFVKREWSFALEFVHYLLPQLNHGEFLIVIYYYYYWHKGCLDRINCFCTVDPNHGSLLKSKCLLEKIKKLEPLLNLLLQRRSSARSCKKTLIITVLSVIHNYHLELSWDCDNIPLNYEGRSSQLYTQLLQLRKERPKKIQACTGFEPLTSAIPVQRFTK